MKLGTVYESKPIGRLPKGTVISTISQEEADTIAQRIWEATPWADSKKEPDQTPSRSLDNNHT